MLKLDSSLNSFESPDQTDLAATARFDLDIVEGVAVTAAVQPLWHEVVAVGLDAAGAEPAHAKQGPARRCAALDVEEREGLADFDGATVLQLAHFPALVARFVRTARSPRVSAQQCVDSLVTCANWLGCTRLSGRHRRCFGHTTQATSSIGCRKLFCFLLQMSLMERGIG